MKHQFTWCASPPLPSFVSCLSSLLLSVSTEITSEYSRFSEKTKCRRIPILTELSELCFKDKMQRRNLCHP